MSFKSLAIYALAGYLILVIVVPRLFALTYQANDVTVILHGCEQKSCHLKGTLTQDPWSLDYHLTQANGQVTVFNTAEMSLMIIPQQPD